MCVPAASFALICFLSSAFLSLFTIIRGFGARAFPEGPVTGERELWIRLGKIDEYHNWQSRRQKMGLAVTIFATALLIFTLIISIVGNLLAAS
jgi:hypothetical protein